MAMQMEIDDFLPEENSVGCCSKWWHQKYHHQEVICRAIESFQFRVIVILLVVIDTLLVIGELMLDSMKIYYQCEVEEYHDSTNEIFKERIHHTMEIVHYTSISILVFFLLELFVRIYASGKEFYNIRRKKMEYFDAIIVIISLGVDLYLLSIDEKLSREGLLFKFSFRLWRFVRIVSSKMFSFLLRNFFSMTVL